MRILLILSIFCVGILSAVIKHPWNFTPILSIVLLSGFYIKQKYSFLLPLSIVLCLYFILPPISLLLYAFLLGSYASIYLLGLYFLKKTFKSTMILSFVSAAIFFIVSNFGVWLIGYPKSLPGFILCYEQAIPFFKNTLISTMAFSAYFYLAYRFMYYYEKIYNKATT